LSREVEDTLQGAIFRPSTVIRLIIRLKEENKMATPTMEEEETKTADISVTLVLPSGGSRTAEVPRDVPIKELIPELTTSLELPTTGPDGRPTSYRLDSKAFQYSAASG
jgi:hypothetical protein